jgi:CxxC-x17-CxxC domain-containing protein
VVGCLLSGTKSDIVVTLKITMSDFNKKSFSRPSFGGNRGGNSSGRSFEMFQAVCASCGKSCEVPFRPNGKKPVYCKECFAKNGGPSAAPHGSNDRFAPRRDFARAPSYKPEFKPQYNQGGDNNLVDLKKQVEAMNAKLDKIMKIIDDKAPTPDQTDAYYNFAPNIKEKKHFVKKFSKGKKK